MFNMFKQLYDATNTKLLGVILLIAPCSVLADNSRENSTSFENVAASVDNIFGSFINLLSALSYVSALLLIVIGSCWLVVAAILKLVKRTVSIKKPVIVLSIGIILQVINHLLYYLLSII